MNDIDLYDSYHIASIAHKKSHTGTTSTQCKQCGKNTVETGSRWLQRIFPPLRQNQHFTNWSNTLYLHHVEFYEHPPDTVWKAGSKRSPVVIIHCMYPRSFRDIEKLMDSLTATTKLQDDFLVKILSEETKSQGFNEFMSVRSHLEPVDPKDNTDFYKDDPGGTKFSEHIANEINEIKEISMDTPSKNDLQTQKERARTLLKTSEVVVTILSRETKYGGGYHTNYHKYALKKRS
jgi:hypothetical protein